MKCRHCGEPLVLDFIDLGSAPPSNAYLSRDALKMPEKWYPLQVKVCSECWLVQTEDYAHHTELFSSDYAYFSSFSSSWLAHAESYVAQMVERFSLGGNSRWIEVAANDGYLLQYVHARGIPCLGIEPTESTANAARAKGLEVVGEFFGVEQAKKMVLAGKSADLMTANNVLAHVPDINDFVAGFSVLLKPQGVATFEFPNLLELVQQNQFDTIYHEHFSYLSLTSVQRIFAANQLNVFDVELLPTHGGSLRVYAQRKDCGQYGVSARVTELLQAERDAGVTSPAFYADFQAQANRVKNDFIAFLIEAKRAGKTVAAYGAAAKGNTLMNYAGIRPDLIAFVADRNPAKQDRFMPGSRVPIVKEEMLQDVKPDYVVIFPWNLKHELSRQLAYIQAWNGRLVTAIPHLEVL